MSSITFKMTKAYMDSQGQYYDALEENNIIRVHSKLKNKDNLDVIIIFDEDDKSVQLASYDYCTFPEDKRAKMYEICSKMNHEYRWIKFAVDEKSNTIDLFDDAVIQLDSCGEEIEELIIRMMHVADNAYPSFMKAVWSD